MPNQKNIQSVEELKEKLSKAKSVVFADFLGLKANDINELRSKLTEQEVEVEVAKNTLLKIALKEQGHEENELSEDLQGPTAAIFSYKDAIAPLKTIVDFAKEFELPKIKSALIDGQYNDAQKVEVLSSLPSREELLAKVVGGMNSPISGFHGALNSMQSKFVYALNALKEKKEESN